MDLPVRRISAALLVLSAAAGMADAMVPVPVLPAAGEAAISAQADPASGDLPPDGQWPGDTTIAATIGILFAMAVVGWCHLVRCWLRRRRLIRAQSRFSAFVSQLRLQAVVGEVDQLLEYEAGGRRFHQRSDFPGPMGTGSIGNGRCGLSGLSPRGATVDPPEPASHTGFRLPAGIVFDDATAIGGEMLRQSSSDTADAHADTGGHSSQSAESAGHCGNIPSRTAGRFRRVRFCRDGRVMGSLPEVEAGSESEAPG